jgi:hypothetical protein
MTLTYFAKAAKPAVYGEYGESFTGEPSDAWVDVNSNGLSVMIFSFKDDITPCKYISLDGLDATITHLAKTKVVFPIE